MSTAVPEGTAVPEATAAPAAATADMGQRAARGALWLSLGSWTSKGMQVIVLVVLAHFLAPADFGVLAIASLSYNVLQALNNLGIPDALTYRKDRVEEAARTAFTLMIGAGAVLTVAAWLAAPTIAGFFHAPDAVFVLRGFALGIAFEAAAEVPIAMLTRSLQFRRRVLTDGVPYVLGGLVTLAVVAAGHSLGGLVIGQVVQSVASLVIALTVSHRCWPGWSRKVAAEMIRYGGHLGGAAVVLLGLLNVDYIVVGHALGDVRLGWYSLAFRICYMPFLAVSFVVNGAAFPYYCRLHSLEDIGQAAARVFGLVNAASVPLFAGLVLFAGDVTLLGHKWAPAVPVIRWLAVYGLLFSMINSGQAVLKAAGRPQLVLASRLLHLAALAGVLVTTASRGIAVVGMDQAAVAGAVAAVTLWWAVRYCRVAAASVVRDSVLPLVGAGAMAAAVLLGRLLPGFGTVPSLPALLVLGPAALLAYGAVVLAVMRTTVAGGWELLRARAA